MRARQRRTFTPEFKLQMVRLFENGKSKSDIVREYTLTNDEKELRKLRKENQQLKMENDILKQAALIMGRK
ncbi:hypothetical protein [Macrococcoides caseolyticum]|uniref:hypothetical protein n=1 Tax=Macrococcoides caseolyticum TaxID=69966 RepID=UPI0024BD150F|nr:hypothetical protein [Macrococcus caseolyticus]MDJ1089104.1 hypothetical protein [Macrococcus caseolyticus]